MSTQQMIQDLISQAPESKLNTILSFIQFVLHENMPDDNALLSEPSLAKDWLSEEEDAAWQNL